MRGVLIHFMVRVNDSFGFVDCLSWQRSCGQWFIFLFNLGQPYRDVVWTAIRHAQGNSA
jgi:hypothetical protein